MQTLNNKTIIEWNEYFGWVYYTYHRFTAHFAERAGALWLGAGLDVIIELKVVKGKVKELVELFVGEHQNESEWKDAWSERNWNVTTGMWSWDEQLNLFTTWISRFCFDATFIVSSTFWAIFYNLMYFFLNYFCHTFKTFTTVLCRFKHMKSPKKLLWEDEKPAPTFSLGIFFLPQSLHCKGNFWQISSWA